MKKELQHFCALLYAQSDLRAAAAQRSLINSAAQQLMSADIFDEI